MNDGLQLYQKYKKYKLSDIVGHEPIKEYYRTRFKQRTIPFVNMFVGGSGTGKTTFQRVVALSLVCDNLDKEGNSCLECESCRDILDGQYAMSVKQYNGFNIDVDSVKDIVSDAYAISMTGKPKIIIIDEFQGISSERASKTLLKVLEDETTDAYWLIGAMDRTKISTASSSRGVYFNIEPLSFYNLVEIIDEVLVKEKVQYPKEFFNTESDIEELGISTIINGSQGNARCALSFLETVISAKVWTPNAIASLLGLTVQAEMLASVKHIITGNTKEFLNQDIKWNEESLRELRYILKELVRKTTGHVYEFNERWKLKKIESLPAVNKKHTNILVSILNMLYSIDAYPVRTRDLIEHTLLSATLMMANKKEESESNRG